MLIPDPIWIHFIQLGHVVGFKQKRENQKKNYFGDLYKENNNNILTNIPDTSSPAALMSAFALVASTSSNSTSLDASTSFISNKKVSTKNTRITNYITSDRISKTEQKLLELEFAQSIFQCSLVLSLPEMEPIKKL
ncbi:18622_t:CDS:2 [Gigaspora rosea]|nr:18622_t:CDS:2 [Gigaspora rosea]